MAGWVVGWAVLRDDQFTFRTMIQGGRTYDTRSARPYLLLMLLRSPTRRPIRPHVSHLVFGRHMPGVSQKEGGLFYRILDTMVEGHYYCVPGTHEYS